MLALFTIGKRFRDMDENTQTVLLAVIAALGTGFGAWIGYLIGKKDGDKGNHSR